MKPFIAITILTFASVTSLGCSMCCGPYDYDYPTFGGQHERADRTYGRMGSVFSDPMANASGPSADSNRHAGEPALKSETGSGRSDYGDSDEDIEDLKRQLELMTPTEKPESKNLDPQLNNQSEELPAPDDNDPIANRPRRSQWQWR